MVFREARRGGVMFGGSKRVVFMGNKRVVFNGSKGRGMVAFGGSQRGGKGGIRWKRRGWEGVAFGEAKRERRT